MITVSAVECVKVSKVYGEANVVLKDLSFSLAEGEILAVTGPSGCGKTTLLRIIGLIDRPTAGKVIVKGHDTSDMDEDELVELRRTYIGFSFQEPTFIPTLSVLENVLLPIYPIARGHELKRWKERALELLEALGLSGLERRKPGKLSTGQRKRVDLARALLKDPDILIADEPTASVDEATAELIREVLTSYTESGEKALIFAVHRDPELLRMADRHLDLTKT
ncbi:hypothetical protein DRO33_01870 [Candidatus Bathyarchaeota archaeon]|nr:MAG: hypothetical protein DRO33_01870 [Candidatus Bathyarchaeota archaeon]